MSMKEDLVDVIKALVLPEIAELKDGLAELKQGQAELRADLKVTNNRLDDGQEKVFWGRQPSLECLRQSVCFSWAHFD